LHSDRSPNERTQNLDKFKQNKVRFLICTDVAARGLDISGISLFDYFVIIIFKF
jgi:ATP-dependent RNA helicase DDX1